MSTKEKHTMGTPRALSSYMVEPPAVTAMSLSRMRPHMSDTLLYIRRFPCRLSSAFNSARCTL